MASLQEDDRCEPKLHEFISYIRKYMLVVDPEVRAAANDVRDFLNTLRTSVGVNSA